MYFEPAMISGRSDIVVGAAADAAGDGLRTVSVERRAGKERTVSACRRLLKAERPKPVGRFAARVSLAPAALFQETTTAVIRRRCRHEMRRGHHARIARAQYLHRAATCPSPRTNLFPRNVSTGSCSVCSAESSKCARAPTFVPKATENSLLSPSPRKCGPSARDRRSLRNPCRE